jgi:excisionase family DNA binding protein
LLVFCDHGVVIFGNMGIDGELLTLEQAAAELGVSVRHVYNLRVNNDLPELRNCHTREVRVPKQAVLALKKARRTFEPVLHQQAC